MRKIHAMAALGKIQELNALLDSGENINDVDCHGNTPLYYAAYFERQEALDVLSKRGADLSLSDERGVTHQARACHDALASVVNAPAMKHCMGNVRVLFSGSDR